MWPDSRASIWVGSRPRSAVAVIALIWLEVKETRLVEVKALSCLAESAATLSGVSAATSSVLSVLIVAVPRFLIWLAVRLEIIEVMDARPCSSESGQRCLRATDRAGRVILLLGSPSAVRWPSYRSVGRHLRALTLRTSGWTKTMSIGNMARTSQRIGRASCAEAEVAPIPTPLVANALHRPAVSRKPLEQDAPFLPFPTKASSKPSAFNFRLTGRAMVAIPPRCFAPRIGRQKRVSRHARI